jgi:transposase-like protein
MSKKGDPVYSRNMKLDAVRRMEAGVNVSALSRELGVKRKRLYAWRDSFRVRGKRGQGKRGQSELLTILLTSWYRPPEHGDSRHAASHSPHSPKPNASHSAARQQPAGSVLQRGRPAGFPEVAG